MSGSILRNRLALGLLWIGLSVITTGCKAVPVMRYYTLQPRAAAIVQADHAAAGVTIGVQPFRVDSPYDQERIAYRVGADSPEIAFYEYHRWGAPLEAMMPRIAIAALQDVEGVGRIEPSVSGGRQQLTLAGRVVTLEEVDSPAGQHVRLELVLTLRDADGSILWSDTLRGESETSAETVEAIVTQIGDVADSMFRSRREEFARILASVDRQRQ